MYIDVFKEIFDSGFGYGLLMAIGIIAILGGLLMLYGIKSKGTVIIINRVFRKKNFDNEILLSKYTIQSFYTMLFGVIVIGLTVMDTFSRFNIFIVMLGFSLFDLLFDIFAIKKSTIS